MKPNEWDLVPPAPSSATAGEGPDIFMHDLAGVGALVDRAEKLHCRAEIEGGASESGAFNRLHSCQTDGLILLSM